MDGADEVDFIEQEETHQDRSGSKTLRRKNRHFHCRTFCAGHHQSLYAHDANRSFLIHIM